MMLFLLSLHSLSLNAIASKSAMCMLVISQVSLYKVPMARCLIATEGAVSPRTDQLVHGTWTVKY